MSEQATLARPYARAVFELAREGGDFAAWSEALAALSEAVAAPEVAALIGHPALTRAQLGEAFAEALKGASAPVRNLVRLLAENGRLRLLPAIRDGYEALRAEAEGRVDVRVTTAVEADEAIRGALAEAIARRLARKVNVSWSVDASLLGGALIRAGDTVIDGSVVGELERLRQAVAA